MTDDCRVTVQFHARVSHAITLARIYAILEGQDDDLITELNAETLIRDMLFVLNCAQEHGSIEFSPEEERALAVCGRELAAAYRSRLATTTASDRRGE